MNNKKEILLDVCENMARHGEYWIYDITAFLPTFGMDREKYMRQVTQTVRGGNGVRIHIICKDDSLSFVKGERLAREFYNGNTYSYRLD